MINETVDGKKALVKELTKKALQINIDFIQHVLSSLDEESDLSNVAAFCVGSCLSVYINDHLIADSKKLYAEITDDK